MKIHHRDFDNSWKEALEKLFPLFIKFFFPRIHAQIDWSRPVEFLDDEFQQLLEEAQISKCLVDKLVKVWLKEGKELWILIHIEIQNQQKKDFAQRMYDYHTSIYRRYKHKVASMAILGDRNKNWKPSFFDYNNLESGVHFYFPIVKLLDYYERLDELETSDNPFAFMVMTHLKMLQAGKDVTNLASWKLEITKTLLERGFSSEITSYVLRFIDMIIRLPIEKEKSYRRQVIEIIKEKKMVRTMIPWEEVAFEEGREKGYNEGREEGIIKKSQEAVIDVLETRFDKVPRSCQSFIKKLSNLDILKSLLKNAIKVNSLEEFKQTLQQTK